MVETTTARGEPGFLAVIGFGLNVATSPDDLGRAATSLAANGLSATADDLLSNLADCCDVWLGRWRNGAGFNDVRDAWMARAGQIGEPISVQTRTGPLTGTYQGLAPSGALLADVAGQIETITYGDVALIAQPGKGR